MKELSKFLSYVLRHDPQAIALELDANGWADVDDLIAKAQAAGKPLDRNTLLTIVETSDKKRFTLSDDGSRIRAAQGHSIEVDLDLHPMIPPAMLYHGTAATNIETILSEGLKPGERQKVHLALDEHTAEVVGQRHGKPVVLRIDAAGMHAHGLAFWRADNGVWLTDHVPPQFLRT
jgi:putative RNA 2'-phosphotransferase